MKPGIKEIFLVFLRLGLIAFGGPVAHIGLMEEVLVKEKKWIDSESFLDMLSVSNLIPGPNSTELAIAIGYKLGGVAGLLAVGFLPLSVLFLTFVKIGALLFGSGYVLIAFLQTEFVDRLGVLTSTQLLDAVALGQVKPGPLFTTATFIGTILSGPVGGIVATIGIFLPSFLLVGIIMPFAQKLRASGRLSLFLDGINIASLALFLAVTLRLVPEFIRSPLSVVLFLVSAWLVIGKEVKSHWMILGGALTGLIIGLF